MYDGSLWTLLLEQNIVFFSQAKSNIFGFVFARKKILRCLLKQKKIIGLVSAAISCFPNQGNMFLFFEVHYLRNQSKDSILGGKQKHILFCLDKKNTLL